MPGSLSRRESRTMSQSRVRMTRLVRSGHAPVEVRADEYRFLPAPCGQTFAIGGVRSPLRYLNSATRQREHDGSLPDTPEPVPAERDHKLHLSGAQSLVKS